MPGLDRIWAGWRLEYVDRAIEEGETVEGSAEDRCVFCQIRDSTEPDASTYVLWRGDACFAVLNLFPYTSGHLMVMPNRHLSELEDLSPDEASALWSATGDAVTALKAEYRPGGINLGANMGRAAGAGIPDHFHLHVVPRWGADTNFMTSVADARVLPESISATWERLRRAWPR